MAKPHIVVVGAGVAGLQVANILARHGAAVTLVSKQRLGQGGASPLAQGGIAAAISHNDKPEYHMADTLRAAREIGNEVAASILSKDAPAQIEQLIALGAKFDLDSDGQLKLGTEAAHSHARIVHAHGDQTGQEVVLILRNAVLAHANVQVFEQAAVTELIHSNGKVSGVFAYLDNGRSEPIAADGTVLATGGGAGLYATTTNPYCNTGDGLALAARAGATLADLEFIQFHPTALAVPGNPKPLLSEAIRGAGGVLWSKRPDGTVKYAPNSLAPRDILARWVWKNHTEGAKVFLDVRDLKTTRFSSGFPSALKACKQVGVDPEREPIPVCAAAHYHMGGIATDTRGRTGVGNLWACGEVACNGLHGANRLASNSLLEALVFGAQVAFDILETKTSDLATRTFKCPPASSCLPQQERRVVALRALMDRYVGIIRDAAGLEHALMNFEQMLRDLPQGTSALHHHVLVSQLIAYSALHRNESRGGHYRHDMPREVPGLAKHSTFTLNNFLNGHSVRYREQI